MRLSTILEELNSLEKKQFLNVLENLAEKSQKRGEVESLLDDSDADALKNAEGEVISRVFELLKDEYREYVAAEFEDVSSHTGIVTNILSRDGNSVMSGNWFDKLYAAEIEKLLRSIESLKVGIESGAGELSEHRLRDYRIYLRCVEVAFRNDEDNNQEAKITSDEASILGVLSREMGLSSQEVAEINYMVVPLVKQDLNDVLDYIRKAGLGFIQRKSGTLFVPDEMVKIFRAIHGKEVADKYYRRMLKLLKESEVNLVCKQHGLPMRGIDLAVKIRAIIEAGISFTECFVEGIYKPEENQNERKKRLNEICEVGFSGLKLSGSTLQDKVQSIIDHFHAVESDDHIDIGVTGYDGLLRDLSTFMPELADRLKDEFQFQEADVLKSDFLTNRGVMPRDIVELMTSEELKSFCAEVGISRRGNEVLNTLEHYKDADNLLLENYSLLAARDLNGLKELGIVLRESDLGGKFEEVTKQLLLDMGLKVDEDLRKSINTAKNKVDILLSDGDSEIILIECKSAKDVNYSKFATLTRQMKSYRDMIESKGYRVVKSLLVAPDFSDDFVNAVELEYELNLTLIPAASLHSIHKAFNERSAQSKFPYKMLAHARDVVINPERIIKALSK